MIRPHVESATDDRKLLQRTTAFALTLTCVLTCTAPLPAAAQDAEPAAPRPAPPMQRSVMTYRFLPEFQLHYSIDAALAREIAQALDVLDREAEVEVILKDAAERHAQILSDGKQRIGKAGVDEGNELFKQWHQTYSDVSRDLEPEKQAEKEAAKAKLDVRLEELHKPIRHEMQQVLLEAESLLDETALRLAELSPLERETAQSRVRLAILRRSIMRYPPGTHYGDFQRPMDVRDFIAFASKCDDRIATAFGIEEDLDAYVTATDKLATILDEYDAALLAFLDERLAKRRAARLSDDRPPQKGLSPWARAQDMPHAIVGRIGTALDEHDPPLGEAWRTLFREYLCPELTGFWPADVLIAAAQQQEDAIPADSFEALQRLAQEYELERRRLVKDAITFGITACREHNSTRPGIYKDTEPEQQLFLDKVSQIEALSARTASALITLFESDPELADVFAAIEGEHDKLRRTGGGPWVREHVRKHGGTMYQPTPDFPKEQQAAEARH
jgi:hypothetical protein